jgi:hypothetical protein
MMWLTWRQHRAEAGVGAAILAVVVAGLLVIGIDARHSAKEVGLSSCTRAGGDCSRALEALHRQYHWIPPVTATLIALPLLAGMFWGAPLISGEFEAGTHRLVWTQSISRVRWISSKLAIILGVTTVAAVALGLVAGWALTPLAPAFGTRLGSGWFEIQGIVPAAYVLFALAAGVAAGAILRRTIPAMAVTLVAYAVVRFPVHYLRKQLLPARTRTVTFPLSTIVRNLTSTNALSPFPSSGLAPDDWVVKTTALGPSGHADPFAAVQAACPDLPRGATIGSRPVDTCLAKVAGLKARLVTEYQPAGRFWRLQAIECLIFVAFGVALIVTSIVVVKRTRSL